MNRRVAFVLVAAFTAGGCSAILGIGELPGLAPSAVDGALADAIVEVGSAGDSASDGALVPGADAEAGTDADASSDADALAPGTDAGVKCDVGLLSGLVGYWSFDESTGADDSTNGRPLDLFNGPTFPAGRVGRAMALNGTTQKASRPTADVAFDLGAGQFTVQAWASFDVLGQCQDLVSKYSSTVAGEGPGWTLLKLPDDRFEFAVAGGFSLDTTMPLATATDTWYHVVARRKAGNVVELFVDNVSSAATTNGASLAGPAVVLSVGYRTLDKCFLGGKVDEPAMWNRALSDAEIGALYNGGLGCSLRQ